jgi:hypothetical protein
MGPVSKGLTDVDLDCPTARTLAPAFLPETGAIFGRASSERSHWLYTTSLWETAKHPAEPFEHPDKAKVKGKNDHGVVLVELRTGSVDKDGAVKGAVSLFPGSEHHSGELVEWFDDGEPAQVDGNKLRACVQELAAAILLVDHYPADGRRHKAALVLGGVLARAKYEQDEIEVFVEAVAKAAGDEEWEQRINDVRDSAERWAEGEPTQGRPKLREYWGDEVGDRIADWLGVQGSSASADSDDDDDDKHPGAQKQKKQTELILAYAAEASLFHTNDDRCYADIIINQHRESWPIRSRPFRQWLIHQYYLASDGTVPGEAPLRGAIETLEARARYDGEQRAVHIRIGGDRGKIYLDLADPSWCAVEIDESGWRVVNNPPIRFRRAAGMLPLPMPVKGRTEDGIAALREFVNVRVNERERDPVYDPDFVLLVSFMVAALRDRGPYPGLCVEGEEGSAKTTLFNVVRKLIDPHKIEERRLPRDDRDLFIAANNGWWVAFGNLSHIPEWLSNALCTLATGGGFATRALYTDEDEVMFNARRPIGLNGVRFPVRPDLADRLVFLKLPPFEPDTRRTEEEFWADFESKRPTILGALLDMVAHGLRELPNTPREDYPRMADFAQWAKSCEGAVWEADTFNHAYRANRRKATIDVIEADMVADAIRLLVTKAQPYWDGTTRQLLNALSELVGERASQSKEWPSVPRALTDRLDKAKAVLRRIGIDIRYGGRRSRGRVIKVTLQTLQQGGKTHTTRMTPIKPGKTKT